MSTTLEDRNEMLRYQALAIAKSIEAGEPQSIIENRLSKFAKLADWSTWRV